MKTTLKLNDKSNEVRRFTNAVQRKLKNKRVTLSKREDGSYYFQSRFLDLDPSKGAAAGHVVLKNCVHVTEVRFTEETLIALVLNAMELLNMSTISEIKKEEHE